MKRHRKIDHYDKVFHAQELGTYAQGQGSLAVFKVTARIKVIIKDLWGHLLQTVTFLVFIIIILDISRNFLKNAIYNMCELPGYLLKEKQKCFKIEKFNFTSPCQKSQTSARIISC